jgi:hypothetical protein
MNTLLTALKCKHLQFGFAILLGIVILNLVLYLLLPGQAYLIFLAAVAGSQFGDWASQLGRYIEAKTQKQ